MLARRKQIGVVVSIELLVCASEGHLAEKHEANVILSCDKAVVGRFSDHICEIDSFSEHVASHWSLGRGDSQPLTDDTDEVGQSGSMPKKLFVIDIGSIPLVIAVLFEFVDI